MANICVLYGSVRTNRVGIHAAKWIASVLESRDHTVTLVDPMEYSVPLLDKMYKEYEKGQAPEALEKLHAIFDQSDAFVVVSAEYNHSMPPGLVNMLDHFMPEFFFKPSAIVTYSVGGFGGVRAGIALRSFLAELGMSSMPSMFAISKITQVFNDQGELIDETYAKRVERFVAELEWYTAALASARHAGTPY